jgi:hypothetical protein
MLLLRDTGGQGGSGRGVPKGEGEMRQTKPIWATGAAIGDWGFEAGRTGSVVWTECQTNPITLYVVAPILRGTTYREWEVAGEKQSQSAGRGPGKSEIRSSKPETNPKPKFSKRSTWPQVPAEYEIRFTRYEIRGPRTASPAVDEMRNKANRRGRGPRLGIADCRLGICGRWGGISVDEMRNKANWPGRECGAHAREAGRAWRGLGGGQEIG